MATKVQQLGRKAIQAKEGGTRPHQNSFLHHLEVQSPEGTVKTIDVKG